MTQTFSDAQIMHAVEAEAAFVDDMNINLLHAPRARANTTIAVRKSPWREKPVADKTEKHKCCANPFSVTPIKGFLPDVTLPNPLPPEPVAIADMATMFGVTHRTLHFYEEKAILSSRRSGLMRIYSHRDIHRMAVVNVFREIGIPVATIQEVMTKLEAASSQDEADDIFQSVIETRKHELNTEISSLRRQVQMINDLMLPKDEVDAADDVSDVELTQQEQNCLELMAEGYAPVRLTRTMGISSSELQSLEDSLLQKFSANNRFQAVAKAVVMGKLKA